MLKVRNLTAGYGKKRVLNDVSFEISKGDLVLLTGGNGSGKSTILKTIYGLLSPWKNEDGTNGEILFEGKNIVNIPTSDLLRMGIVYMPQKKNVFDDFTVNENLLTAASIYPSIEARDRISKVFVELPPLLSLKHRTPFSMSGGEKQLLAFGCALLHSPQLMLLDEPFAGMDSDNRQLLLDTITRLNGLGITFIIVEHNKDLFNNIKFSEIELELGKIMKYEKIN